MSRAFKAARRKEVTDFLNIIGKLGISYNQLNHKDGLSDAFWGYHIESLIIPVEDSTLKHIRPLGFSNVNIIVEIEVESQIDQWLKLNDPFTSLNFRSMLKGTNAKTQKVHYLSFHIDRHSDKITNEIHPLYHLQYLQNAKAKPKDDFDHGESMQLDVPRMMHFPMDLILGVSFLLSNFAPSIYTKLVEDRRYINLCKEYQQRIWRPYIDSLNNFWTTAAATWTWDPKLNCPYLS